jgi:hypothetical protein
MTNPEPSHSPRSTRYGTLPFAEQTGKGMPVALIAEEHFVGALK